MCTAVLIFYFFFILPPPPALSLFPYTTLFRSRATGLLRRGDSMEREGRLAGRLGAVDLDHPPAREAEIYGPERSEEHTSELQSRFDLVCRLLLEKKKKNTKLRKLTAPTTCSAH